MQGLGQPPKLMSKISFEKHDTDGDGELDASELKQLCHSLGRHFSDAEIQMAVRKLDKSGDGRIQYDEFKTWWANGESRWQQLELSPEEMAAATQAIAYFDHFDQDKSGAIASDEFVYLHADLVKNGYTTKTVEECLADLDSSGDSLISFNEVRSARRLTSGATASFSFTAFALVVRWQYCDWLERIGALKVKVMM